MKVKYNMGNQAAIDACPLTPGCIYFAKDTRKIYLDIVGTRICLDAGVPEVIGVQNELIGQLLERISALEAAQVVEVRVMKIEDLAAALDENDKVELVLNNDLAVSAPIEIPAGKEVTIDLNGKEIVSSTARDSMLFAVEGGVLTLTGNGTIDAAGSIARASDGGIVIVNGGIYDSRSSGQGFASVGEDAMIIFNDGELTTTEGGLMAFDGAGIEFNGGTLNTRDNFAIGTNGIAGRGGNTITINGGTINGHITSAGYEAVGVYVANTDHFIMNGGLINVFNGCGICQRGGIVELNGGTIKITTDENYAAGGVGDKKKNLEADGVVFDEASLYPNAAAHQPMKLVVGSNVVFDIPEGFENVRVYAADGITPDVTLP